MEELRFKVEHCGNCDLCKTRHRAVFGEGNENADILIIGEAPGAQENIKGIPFVGSA